MTVTVRTELSEEDFAHLYQLGERHGTTVGSLVAELVRRHLAGECAPQRQRGDGRPLDPEVIAAILRLHGEGRSDVAITRELGIAGSTVRRYREEAGLAPHLTTTRLPDEAIAAIRELNAQGLSDRAIGRQLDINNHRVTNYRNALGLPKNYPGGRKKTSTQPQYPLVDPARVGTDTREKTA
jgi:DNA-binding CsgD family transcriptional regulator